MKYAATDQTQRTIAELAQMPVGRRWLLKMGVSAAAILAMPAWAAVADRRYPTMIRGRSSPHGRRFPLLPNDNLRLRLFAATGRGRD